MHVCTLLCCAVLLLYFCHGGKIRYCCSRLRSAAAVNDGVCIYVHSRPSQNVYAYAAVLYCRGTGSLKFYFHLGKCNIAVLPL